MSHVIHGRGSDLKNTCAILNRAKRKVITQKMILSLIDVAKRKKKTDREKQYWNTYHCQNRLITGDGRLFGKYCKNRFCTVCLGVRKASIINNYLPYLSKWENPYFVTLTIKSIPRRLLKYYFEGMLKTLAKIIDKYRKRVKKRGGYLQGIKSLECNFNPVLKSYNPHFHIIVKDKEMANILITEWLSRFPRHAVKKAQFARPVKDKTRDLIELVKYGSKIFTEPNLRNKSKRQHPSIYVSALDNIFEAMSNLRIFDRFGFNLNKQKHAPMSRLVSNYDRWRFSLGHGDWINLDTGEMLTGYSISQELKLILENHLDLVTE